MTKHKKAHSTKIVRRTTFSAVTLVAVVFVFVLAGYYLLRDAKLAGTSQLLIAPASVNVQAGNTFTVEVKDNTTTPVNTVKAYLTYPASLLEVTNIDFNSSFYSKVTSSNSPGTITADMYYLKPVYCGPTPPPEHPGCTEGQLIDNEPAPTGQHLVYKVTFKAKAAGTAQINFTSSSDLLERGDQNSTTVNHVLGSTSGATVNITGTTTTTTPPATTNTTKPSTSSKSSTGTSGSNNTSGGTGSGTTSSGGTENTTGTDATTSADGSQSPIVPLTLTILDSKGNPVSGAEVTIEGNTAVTDSSGKATFSGLAVGKYNATVKANGSEGSYPVEIAPGLVEANQTIQLVAASNKLPVPFLALALGFLALSGVAVLYIFGHKFLKKPHLEEAAAMAPITPEPATADVQAQTPSDSSMLSQLESIKTDSLQPGSVVHPQEYSEHSSLHPDNKPEDSNTGTPQDDANKSN